MMGGKGSGGSEGRGKGREWSGKKRGEGEVMGE